MARTGTRSGVDKKAALAEARRLAEKRAQRNRRLLIGGGVTVVLVAAVVFLATRPAPEALAAVQTLPDQGNNHIDASAPTPEYNSDPPTSGPHDPSPAPCGIYRTAPADRDLVHNLEHGVVIISYDPSVAASDRDQLEAFARDAGTHVLVTPREGMESTIALTAWTKLLRLDAVDLGAIEGFYSQFAQFGPEPARCPFQVDEGQG
jgi:hypothetical protein